MLRRGVVLEGMAVGYNALEGLVAIVAGIGAGSVALTGFSVDSKSGGLVDTPARTCPAAA